MKPTFHRPPRSDEATPSSTPRAECVENPPKALKKIIPARIQPYKTRDHTPEKRVIPPIIYKACPLRIFRDVIPTRREGIALPLLCSKHMIMRLLLQFRRIKQAIHLGSKKAGGQQLVARLPAADPNQMNVIRHQNINRTRQPLANLRVKQDFPKPKIEAVI